MKDRKHDELADLISVTEHGHNMSTKLPNGATISWYEKPGSLPSGAIESGASYTQTFLKPERWYGITLWPWYLRGPFCARLRNRYARRHPEIFGSDYGI